MLKNDIERILIRSYDYFRSILGDRIDLGDLKELSEWIKQDMDEELEYEQTINRNYVVSENQISILRTHGSYCFRDIFGNTIVLKYENNKKYPSILESGNLVIWDENTEVKESNERKHYQSTLLKKVESKTKHIQRRQLDELNRNISYVHSLIGLCLR
jgi:hypothetical protein